MTTLDGGGDRDTVIYAASVLNTATALKSTKFEIVGSGAGLTGTVNWANLGVGVDTVQLFGTAGGDVTLTMCRLAQLWRSECFQTPKTIRLTAPAAPPTCST